MKLVILLVFYCSASCLCCMAQTPAPLTLNECYSLAKQNYPMVRSRELIVRTSGYTIENIQKGYWPQFTINGQASYQSAVTEIPVKIPGLNIPSLSKDQYKMYGEMNQVLYDGGMIRQQKQLQKTSEDIQERQLDAELYQLRGRINQLFFGALLIDEELKQVELVNNDIQLGLNRIEAAIANGTSLRSNADVLKADLLKNKQHGIELRSARKNYIEMLGLFAGRRLDNSTVLAKPENPSGNVEINRPELMVYAAQNKNLDAQQHLISTKAQPKLALFVQGGAGRPALNFLSNNFQGYYIGGIRLLWSPTALYTIKKEKEIIENNKKIIDVQKETFLFNTGMEMNQQHAEIGKYQELLSSDDEIIDLRAHVKATSLVQLENGVINSSDYLREVNAEDQARQSKILHEIQMLVAGYNLQTTSGNQ
jgi:outer membrane protein TolC